MENKVLEILEVSQKQAYIFRSKKLKNNVAASEIIRYVTEPDCFRAAGGELFNEEENLVYSGGGHAVLCFDKRDRARDFAVSLEKFIFEKFPGLELFVKIMDYDPKVTPAENVRLLRSALEQKKGLRLSAFKQVSFGIEKDPDPDSINALVNDKADLLTVERSDKFSAEEKQMFGDYKPADEFENLGGTRDESNFIAVIHIDGNSMGKRVEEIDSLSGKNMSDFDCYRKVRKNFSSAIQRDFEQSILETEKELRDLLQKGVLQKSTGDVRHMGLNIDAGIFPVRRLINSGDDICLVTEGRIGIEVAKKILEKLNGKTNQEDGKNYSACAGVAIVHSKYPFYKAYALAEELCSNAKRAIAKGGEGSETSAIDWHIEFGELYGGVSELREQYVVEGKSLCARPYYVCGREISGLNRYDDWKKTMSKLQSQNLARSKYKGLRAALTQGAEASDMYVKMNLMDADSGNTFLFDALELMDTYMDIDTARRAGNNDNQG